MCPPSGDIQSLHPVGVADRGPEMHFHSFPCGKGMNELNYSYSDHVTDLNLTSEHTQSNRIIYNYVIGVDCAFAGRVL